MEWRWRVECSCGEEPMDGFRLSQWHSPDPPGGDRVIIWRASGEVKRVRGIRRITDGAVLVHEPSDVARVMRQIWKTSLFALFVTPECWNAAWREVTGRQAPPMLPPLIFDPAVVAAVTRFARCLHAPRRRTGSRCWLELVDALAHFDGAFRPPAQGESPAMAMIRRYLLAEPDDRTTLEDLARYTGLSKYHMVRALGLTTGLPPHQFRIRMRLWRARRLLEGGKRPADVALEVGFSDQSHFTSWFRRVFGVTPASLVPAL